MARWENEDVSGLNIPDPVKVETTFLDLNGKETTADQAIAKSTKASDGSQKYFIKYGRNELLDPHQIDSSYAGVRPITLLSNSSFISSFNNSLLIKIFCISKDCSCVNNAL